YKPCTPAGTNEKSSSSTRHFTPTRFPSASTLSDLAVALAAAGPQVTVIASRRGYDNPAVRFAGRELWKGVDIIRISCFGFGKVRGYRL
ncbi:MAG: hypothetical protein ACRD3A_09260, partial [Terriglobales bacterium]